MNLCRKLNIPIKFELKKDIAAFINNLVFSPPQYRFLLLELKLTLII